jgi:PAS domain S-box-containing protein
MLQSLSSIEFQRGHASALYRSLVESLPAIVYLVQPHPPYSPIYVSPFIESLGYALAEWYRSPDLWLSLIHPEDRERVLKETETARAAGQENDYQYRVLTRDGAVRWLHDRGQFVLDDEGQPACWQGVMVDITEHKRAEESLRQSERLKAALLDAVTHDLRTPLTAIKGSVSILLGEGEAPEKQTALGSEGRRELLEIIDQETDRLNRLIEGHLALARSEAGAPPLSHAWGTVDEIMNLTRARAAALTRQHRLEVTIANQHTAVCIDARAVAEVLYLLLDNATKYAPAATCISLTADHAATDMIRLTIEDEGPGIPASLRERVFESFFRITHDDAPVAVRATGTGMGLTIARRIVAAHGGRIWIEAGTGGRGTRVALTLPICNQPQLAIARRVEGAETVAG